MKNNEFDQFIKSNTGKDLTPPEALAWENMNIPLPQKKKRRGFYFIWFGLLGLFFTSGYFVISSTEKNSKIDQNQSSISILNDKIIETSIETSIETKVKNAALQQDIYPSKISSNNLTENKALKTKTFPNAQKTINQNSSENIFISLSKTKTFDAALFDSTSFVNLESGKAILNPPTILEKISKKNFDIVNIDSKFTFLFIPTSDTVKLKLPTFFQASESLDSTEEKNKKRISIYFDIGINLSKNNPNNIEHVNQDYVESAFGNSASLGLRFNLKKKFFLESGFSYQKIHSTFEFHQPLATLIDTVNYQKTYRTRHVFHNNYFSFLELNVGIGKTFLFGENWGSEIALHFNPSFKLKNEGKLLDNDGLDFRIEDFDATPKLFWSADAGVNLFYQKKNNKIFTEINFKQFLLKTPFTTNLNLTTQPQILTIKLGMIRNF